MLSWHQSYQCRFMQREHCGTLAASDPKFLPVDVMFCTSLGILDFPLQECQLNRKRGKLRELSMHSKQLTMNNKAKNPDSSQRVVLWIIHQRCIGIVHELIPCLLISLVNTFFIPYLQLHLCASAAWFSLSLHNHIKSQEYRFISHAKRIFFLNIIQVEQLCEETLSANKHEMPSRYKICYHFIRDELMFSGFVAERATESRDARWKMSL